VTNINTLTDSKPHFLTPQSEAKVSKSISNSTIRLAGGRFGNPWLTIFWTKVQEHGKEVAGKVDLKMFRMKNKTVFNEVCGAGGDVCKETSRLSCQTLLSYR
jgi:hypothetical protein